MNRRHFLASLGAMFAGAAVDPDFIKWEKGAKTFFDTAGPRFTGGWIAGDTLRVGDMFTIEGCFARNPLTYHATDHLQYFCVTADVVASGDVIHEWEIAPMPRILGPYANCTDRPRQDVRLVANPFSRRQSSAA